MNANAKNKDILLIGIDDTDNLESRGTGFLARCLAEELRKKDMAIPLSVSRHQLLVDPRVPYTSHNSSLCIKAELKSHLEDVAAFADDFSLERSAEGSDVGVCVVRDRDVTEKIVKFGWSAKTTVLNQPAARALADEESIHLVALRGTGDGIIGALAGVGLRFSNKDGRFPWLPGVREVEEGVYTTADLFKLTALEAIQTLDGAVPSESELIYVTDWTRAVMKDGRATLLIEEVRDDERNTNWRTAPKTVVKRF